MREKLRDMTRYAPGIILISLGLIIVAFPMLLVAFISALLVMAGFVAIVVAHKARGLLPAFEEEP